MTARVTMSRPGNFGPNDLPAIAEMVRSACVAVDVKLAGCNAKPALARGGEMVAALDIANATEQFTYVSTTGGTFLEWLEGKMLPGVEVLMGAQRSIGA